MDAIARDRPRFKSCIEPVVDGRDGLLLLREGGDEWLPHPVFAALAPLLDGSSGVAQIFSELTEEFDGLAVLRALQHLDDRGVLAEDDAALPRVARAFWEQAGTAPGAAADRLRAGTVSVKALGAVDAAPLFHVLSLNGLTPAAEGDTLLCVTDDYLHPDLGALNSAALETGRRWMLVRPVGIETWLGPAFEPGRTACWECLAHRLRWHRRAELHAAHLGKATGTPAARLPGSSLAVLAEAATEAARWIGTGGASALADRVLSTSLLTCERRAHDVIRRPQCPACGDPTPADAGAAAPVRLTPQPVQADAAGGFRGQDADTVLDRLGRYLSPVSGVVGALEPGRRTAPPETGPWVTPTYAADHNFADLGEDRFGLAEGMRRRSGGKGRTAKQARISALAESLERYCGVFDGTEPRLRARLADLGGAGIAPNAVMGYSEAQFAARAARNTRGHRAHWVPEPFDETAEVDWTPLWSLTGQRMRYLPTSICYFGYRGPGAGFGRGDSNGCAAGALREEAILQGLLELVERDAVAIWWYNRLSRPAFDLASLPDPYAKAHMAHYAGIGRSVWALDLTHDLGIPVVAALSAREGHGAEDIIYGFGCHPDPQVAATRALTEVNQSLEAVPAAGGGQADRAYLGSAEAIDWWTSVRCDSASYLSPDPDAPARGASDLPGFRDSDLARLVQTCVDRLQAAGIEVLVLDQTRPDIDFPVVRVVAPGLRHFWARFGPGRLYDVPVRLGWRDTPCAETDLNPHVIQF